MHVLDNPVWHALTGPHATLAEGNEFAARYVRDVAAFAALPDEIRPESWDALRTLLGPGGAAGIPRDAFEAPDGWTTRLVLHCRQMWLTGALASDADTRTSDDKSTGPIEPLSSADVSEMLDLVERTKPGPFAKRTIELGTYLGIRDLERKDLVAMAGERMHPSGFTEISAVCTDADHRGHGLASQLVRALVHSIRNRDETPFLHLTLDNEPAHRVYSELGFETRRLVDVIVLQAPE